MKISPIATRHPNYYEQCGMQRKPAGSLFEQPHGLNREIEHRQFLAIV
jgi:hypothetical protein